MESSIPMRSLSGDLSKLSRRYGMRPNESELSAPFLDSRDATSNVKCEYAPAASKGIESNKSGKGANQIWKIYPVSIPIKAIGIWLACCCLIIFPAIMYFTGDLISQSIGGGYTIGFGFAICGVGLFIITPMMMGMLHLANQSVGNEAYLRLDESKELIELPRLQVSFQTDQVHEVVSIRVDDVVQTLLLVEEPNQPQAWATYHVANLCAASHSISIELSKQLGIECRKFNYNAKQVRKMRGSIV